MRLLVLPALVASAALSVPCAALASDGCDAGNSVCFTIGETWTSYGRCYTTIYVKDMESFPVNYRLTTTLDDGTTQVNSSTVFPSRRDEWTIRACKPSAMIEMR
jgi:hypothetical protein